MYTQSVDWKKLKKGVYLDRDAGLVYKVCPTAVSTFANVLCCVRLWLIGGSKRDYRMLPAAQGPGVVSLRWLARSATTNGYVLITEYVEPDLCETADEARLFLASLFEAQFLTLFLHHFNTLFCVRLSLGCMMT